MRVDTWNLRLCVLTEASTLCSVVGAPGVMHIRVALMRCIRRASFVGSPHDYGIPRAKSVQRVAAKLMATDVSTIRAQGENGPNVSLGLFLQE